MSSHRVTPYFMLALVLIAACGASESADEAADSANKPRPVEAADDFGNADGQSTQSDRARDGGADDDGAAAGSRDRGAAGASAPSSPIDQLPRFPGAGTSDAADPLENGEVCDSVSGAPPLLPEPVAECYADKNDPTSIAATVEQVLECVDGVDTIHVRLTLHPWFVDNTYGIGSIGWPPVRGHWFFDLLVSDHAEMIIKDGAGEIALRFKLDYLTEDATRESGFGSLGVLGGDGSMLVGDAASIVRWSTSLDRNLNERGYGSYTIDSPLTDTDFSPNPQTPDWDYRVVYEAWIDASAFGSAGFGGASIEYVHASPAKSENETIEVEPGECPPCNNNDPDATCGDPPPPPPPDCGDNDPDADCGSAGAGGTGGTGGTGSDDTVDCKENPDDPACNVD